MAVWKQKKIINSMRFGDLGTKRGSIPKLFRVLLGKEGGQIRRRKTEEENLRHPGFEVIKKKTMDVEMVT